MTDFRAFCTPPAAEPTEIVLSKEETHHLVAVNRARPGDTVVEFDGIACRVTTALDHKAFLP